MHDDWPFAGPDPSAALFRHSRDRSGARQVEHLRTFIGILHAEAYAGYRQLYESSRSPGPVTEVLCRNHGRRKFYELADIAAGKRLGKRTPPISPPGAELNEWMLTERARLSRHADVAKTMEMPHLRAE